MSEARWLGVSERWLRLLLRLYPAAFREDVGEALVETYRDRCRAALSRGGVRSLLGVWLRALADSLRNGLGERVGSGDGARSAMVAESGSPVLSGSSPRPGERSQSGGSTHLAATGHVGTPIRFGRLLRPGGKGGRSGDWGRDAALAMRRLARAPMFAALMVATLTVGLAAFAVVYTAVYKVLIEPLPYERPDDLYFVWRDYGPIFDLNRGWLGGPDVAELDSVGGVIEGAVGLRGVEATLAGTAKAEPEEIRVMLSSPDLFELLGASPMLGRDFAPDEVGPGRTPVVVLGHDLWTTRFGGDVSIIGSEVRLNDEPFRVIGVMGPSFRFVQHQSLGAPEGADAYITFGYHLAERGGGGSFSGLIRVRPGTSPERVAAAVGAVGASIDERFFDSRGLRLYPVGIRPDLVSRFRPALVVLGAAAGFLILVLLLNLAALLLVRAAHREREFAVSRALGANGLALTRATLFEGGLLGMLGGAGGALAAVWGTRMLVALAPLDLPRRESIVVDWQIAVVVVGVGALLGLLAAAPPAIWATRTGLRSLLANAAVRGGGAHGRLRRGMVVVQVALSLVLLSAGGLVVRSFEQLLRANAGFDPAGVLTLRVRVPESRYSDDEAATSLHERIQLELAALRGVTAVGATSDLPLSVGGNQTTVRFPGAPGNTGDEREDDLLVDWMRARPDYFDVLKIPVLAGRAFDAAPRGGAVEVLIDRTLATRFFPTGSPLGATLVQGDDSLTVIGVLEHARLYDVHKDGRPQVYMRNDDNPSYTLSWALRTDRRPLDLVPEVRAAIGRIDPQLALADIRSMDKVVSESLRQQRLSAVLIAGFSLGALLLAAMGLFGVVSGSVTRRRHELAVRLALGANHGRVIRLVLREGVLLIALGLLVGVPGIYFSGEAIRGVLVGVSPFDPLTLVAVACGLSIVALAACYVPTRRVARLDPARSLRDE